MVGQPLVVGIKKGDRCYIVGQGVEPAAARRAKALVGLLHDRDPPIAGHKWRELIARRYGRSVIDDEVPFALGQYRFDRGGENAWLTLVERNDHTDARYYVMLHHPLRF